MFLRINVTFTGPLSKQAKSPVRCSKHCTFEMLLILSHVFSSHMILKLYFSCFFSVYRDSVHGDVSCWSNTENNKLKCLCVDKSIHVFVCICVYYLSLWCIYKP